MNSTPFPVKSWQTLITSLDLFTDDFMIERSILPMQERNCTFDDENVTSTFVSSSPQKTKQYLYNILTKSTKSV